MATISLYDPAVDTAKYDAMLRKTLKDQLNDEETFDYAVLSFYYKKAFDFAKANKLYLSKFYFDQGDILLKEIKSEIPHLWTNLFALPKKAYFLYKKRALNEAASMTLQVIYICNSLKQKGNNYLVFAELQQYQNLSKVYFFSDKVKEALEISSECLKFLYSGTSKLVSSSYLSPNSLNDDKNKLNAAFIYQLFLETVNIILKMAKGDKILLARWLKSFLYPSQQLDNHRDLGNECQQIRSIIDLFSLIIDLQWDNFSIEASSYIHSDLVIDERLQETLSKYIEAVRIDS